MYQLGDKPGEYKDLGADIPIFFLFSKYRFAIKIKKKNRIKQVLHEVPTTLTNLYAKSGIKRPINLAHMSI